MIYKLYEIMQIFFRVRTAVIQSAVKFKLHGLIMNCIEISAIANGFYVVLLVWLTTLVMQSLVYIS